MVFFVVITKESVNNATQVSGVKVHRDQVVEDTTHGEALNRGTIAQHINRQTEANR